MRPCRLRKSSMGVRVSPAMLLVGAEHFAGDLLQRGFDQLLVEIVDTSQGSIKPWRPSIAVGTARTARKALNTWIRPVGGRSS